MSVPGLTKAASLPSKTWHCACKKVKIECIAGGNFLSECYCDDCYIRTKVMKDKYCGPCELAGRYHEFEKNGSRPMINQDTASMKVVKGRAVKKGLFYCAPDGGGGGPESPKLGSGGSTKIGSSRPKSPATPTMKSPKPSAKQAKVKQAR